MSQRVGPSPKTVSVETMAASLVDRQADRAAAAARLTEIAQDTFGKTVDVSQLSIGDARAVQTAYVSELGAQS